MVAFLCNVSWTFETAADRSDLVLTALGEVFRQKQLLQWSTTADGSQIEGDIRVKMTSPL